MTENKNTKQTVLITGASAGIGFELAKIFARNGYNLILVARRLEAMQKLATKLTTDHGVQVEVFSADLSDPKSPESIFAFTQEKNIHVDVLVNNAGFGAKGAFARIELSTHLEMLQVNITSLIHLTRLYLPGMLEANRGGVMNVASTAAFVPGPLMAVYYASKAFVLSFSEALHNEVQGTNLKISCLCPGATATEFQARAKMDESKLFKGPLVASAEAVAKEGFVGFKAGKPVVVTGLLNKVAVLASRALPDEMLAAVARKAQEQ